MTTQVLMSTSVHVSGATVASDQHNDKLFVEAAQPAKSSTPVAAETRKLPYRANHQAELMHLQAETEALLQRLQTLKQQRMTEVPADDEVVQSIEANLVAAR